MTSCLTVSFQHLQPECSFSGFLLSLSTSRSFIGGSSANALHLGWHSLTRHSPIWLFPPTTMSLVQVGFFWGWGWYNTLMQYAVWYSNVQLVQKPPTSKDPNN